MRVSITVAITLLIVASAGAEARAAGPCDAFTPFGVPVLESADESNIIAICESKGSAAFFLTDYDRSEVAPHWVAYSLSHDQMIKVAKSKITRKKDGIDFQPEPQVDTDDFASPTHHDYDGIGKKGFDRGHYLPAEAMKWSLDAYHSTFSVANIALQASKFNQQVWQKLENQERGWACDHDTIFAVTGVIFGGPHAASFKPSGQTDLKIFIPTHYWKIVFTEEDGGKAIGAIFKNSKSPGTLQNAIHSVREIENLAGIDLMPDMPQAKQDEIEEADPDLSFWRLDYPSQFKCKD
jgi:endonuclease G